MADRLISADVLKSRVLQGQFKIGQDGTWYVLGLIDAIPTKDTKEIFYDGYVHCLVDFGWDTVLCKDCEHYKPSAVADRKMCFRKDVDGVEVCYDFLPYDSCTYGERKDGGEK